MTLECGGEVAGVVISDGVGYLRDAVLAAHEHLRRMLHAPLQDVLVDRKPESLPETLLQLRPIEANHAGELRNVGRIHVVPCQIVARLVDADDIARAGRRRTLLPVSRSVVENSKHLQQQLDAQRLQMPIP